MMLKRTLSIAALAASAPVMASEWTQNYYFENDLFANTDRSYTNGVRMSAVSPDVTSYLDDPRVPVWLRQANTLLEPFYPVPETLGDEVTRKFIFTLGQQMYTPSDAERTTLDLNDRPYAGWLYAGFGFHAATANKLKSVEVNLGIVGPASFAHETQDFVHELRGIETFEGWDNQLENELGVQLIYEEKQAWRWALNNRLGYDFISHYGGSIGNVASYLNAGGEMRFGWNLPKDFGTSALRPGGDNSSPGATRTSRSIGLHGFISIDGRIVLNNIFLDGNTFRNSHSVSKKHFVADGAIGIASTYENWKVSVALVHRTKEFKQQGKGHAFGSITLSYNY
ncbi:lipid A deacylase LpxR family protein [Neptunomonas sp. XY-337]|uniref:lipid A deacylase LpxR family protein n=1 Tax=Neptunomonas sp. XY-337 TaxID=2561897 RepID=UPI0010AB4473|nr:lipid A deacylase LpxR family protein [Neptunomonas sp. XY-337]